MLLLSLPVIVLMEPILNLWLVDVPEYAVIFGQWILGANLFGTYALMLYTPMMASGRLKENSYASVFVTIFGVVALYFILKAGGSVMWVQYLTLATTLLYSYVVKPIIVCKYIPDYKWRDLLINTWQMVCKDLCDKFYPISTVDKDAILKACQEEKIDGITTIASDVATLTVSYVAEKMGLIGNPDKYSQTATNKYLMRQCFMEHDVPSPKFSLIDDVDLIIK